ncbi:MAG TPA: hypothetical protein VL522_02470 [Bordetella sp.]|jgi:hypothetical protein|nr:hypothetical protein [Bordetella sp.]
MYYRHPRIGFAFDMPDEWDLDSARVVAEGVMVVLRLGDTRLLLQIRRSQGNAAARHKMMTEHLASVRAARIGPCPAPPFGQSRDIVALSFFIAGHQQRWISVGQDGYDYTISHTDDWQDVAGAVDRLSASFVFPAPALIGHALTPRAAAAPAIQTTRNDPWPARQPDMEWAGTAALPPHAALDPAYSMQQAAVAAVSLWQRVGARLRRVARTQE